MSKTTLRDEPCTSKESFEDFYTEVKEIEKRDSVLTPTQQIDRLLRPGSTYFNLNPFEVLQIDPDVEVADIKKRYRTLSILVHPDKNHDNQERAQMAFDIVARSWKILENDLTRKKCLEVYEEAKGRTDHMIAEKRKKLKKEGRSFEPIPEDDPVKYKHAIYVMVMKLFADMERRRQKLDQRDQEERKRKRETEIEEEERVKADREWQQNFEESRQSRVNSWHDFQSGAGKSKKTKKPKHMTGMMVPPKFKPETR
ncbi:dnaJ homolog subfamily C member 8 isoform X1 [Drosophila innubila]|uniref:dnaJ homolog subfamily C member 8 isoform X1 n=1 Tax=Drosophila innubila TaxID=198719 RepID=UPI00148BCD40|nr:dnaJ homolog subfamily C member 8 isoform X1 [Drosophila innubila]